ncbi:R3H domain-containing nucleic acid-binding protein [Pseudanabaena sp. BC1403]|uniref:Jag family protein n=1 Tax=Pseudanabaena sp. BC1403 TaxID=2043171 RepID=UPI000CD83076|nr:R3H domain-containing nucleic acid-binding protein [Pseudanabaena sp. BC1403]
MEDTSAGANWLQELLSLMGYATSVDIRLAEVSPEQAATGSKNYWLDISADGLQDQQIQRLIGKDGIVLDSLQYLSSILLNRHLPSDKLETENRNFYTVELNGYRSNRIADLQSLAENAVKQVRETQTEFVIKQLSSADRRHIHQLLEDFPDIETHSQGREPNRHLIVKLVQS